MRAAIKLSELLKTRRALRCHRFEGVAARVIIWIGSWPLSKRPSRRPKSFAFIWRFCKRSVRQRRRWTSFLFYGFTHVAGEFINYSEETRIDCAIKFARTVITKPIPLDYFVAALCAWNYLINHYCVFYCSYIIWWKQSEIVFNCNKFNWRTIK